MEAVNGMKIFEVSEDEWYAAPTAEDAVNALLEDQSCLDEQMLRDEGYLGEGYPRELTDEEANSYQHDGDDEHPIESSVSFFEWLRTNTPTSAQHFASGNC